MFSADLVNSSTGEIPWRFALARALVGSASSPGLPRKLWADIVRELWRNLMPFRSSSGAAFLRDPQRRRSCRCMSLGSISSVRATARNHAVWFWLWQCFNARRKLASVTRPEAPASDCLAEAAGWLCCRNGHVSDDCRAAVELSELGQVRADEPILPCRHASHAALRF